MAQGQGLPCPTLVLAQKPAREGWPDPHTLLAQKVPGVVTVIQDCSFPPGHGKVDLSGVVTVIQDCSFPLGHGKVDLSIKALSVLKHECALQKQ